MMRILRQCALMFVFISLAFFRPALAQETDMTDTKVLESDEELFREIDRHSEEDYFQDVVISPDREQVEVDGEKESFSEAFDLTKKQADQILSSEEKTREWLSGQEYETEVKSGGEIHVSAPYQSKRIIVKGLLKKDFGAEFIYRDKEYTETILQFSTPAEAKRVCESLNRQYGEGTAVPDLIASGCQTGVTALSASTQCLSWGGAYMGFDKIRDSVPSSYSGRKVTVAVIDGGYNKKNNLMKGRKISRYSKSFRGDGGGLNDLYGHGCVVTGILSDLTPSNVELMILKVSDENGEAPLVYLKKAIDYARKHGADVINLSMGVRATYKIHYLDSVIDKAYNNGVPVVVASGNFGENVKYTYPANYARTICVGALDENHSYADYSNYGSRIDFAAPGSEIISCDKTGTSSFLISSGTSMAAPHVSAACAYIKMMKPKLSAYGVFRELKAYSHDLGKAGRDSYYGWGVPKISSIYKKGIRNAAYVVVHPGAARIKSVKNVGKGIRVRWKKNAYTAKYVLYRKIDNGGFKKFKVIDGANVTGYTDRSVKQGKTYRYKIRTYKLGYYGKMSGYRTRMRLGGVRISARKKTRRSILVSWKKRKNSKAYQIQCSGTKTFKEKKTFTVSSGKNMNVLEGLKPGKVYYVRVRSKSKNGSVVSYGAWSRTKAVSLK